MDSLRASQLDGGRVEHRIATIRNPDASLSLDRRLRGAGGDSAAGARRDSAGRVAIADIGAPPCAVIRLGRGRCRCVPQYCWARSQREQMSTWRWHRAHRNNRASSIAPPDEEGWTIRLHPANTAYGAVRKCGSGRSLGRDRQVNRVRGCVGLFAESDLTPTPGRRHRGCARRQRPLISNIGSGGKQRHNSGGAAGTTQSAFALFWPIRLRRAVRRIRAPLRSHQQVQSMHQRAGG